DSVGVITVAAAPAFQASSARSGRAKPRAVSKKQRERFISRGKPRGGRPGKCGPRRDQGKNSRSPRRPATRGIVRQQANILSKGGHGNAFRGKALMDEQIDLVSGGASLGGTAHETAQGETHGTRREALHHGIGGGVGEHPRLLAGNLLQ